MLRALIPLKAIAGAKSRLRQDLSDGQRTTLVMAMARDVIDVACRHPAVSGVVVIAGEQWEEHLPASPGLAIVRERDLDARGLNPLLHSAVASLGPGRTLVLHGDLPFLGSEDLDALADQLDRRTMVLCPDAAGRGTNALAFREDAAPEFCFGANSFARHRRAARELRCDWGTLAAPGFARDLDSLADLRVLLHGVRSGERVGSRVAQWVQQYAPALDALCPAPADAMPSAGAALTRHRVACP